MLKKLFKYLLKKYTRSEKDRIEVIEELWDGVLYNYNEQTYPGNIRNMQIEIMMGNPYIRFAACSYDNPSIQLLKMNMEIAVDESIEYLKSENSEINRAGADLLIGFKSIKTKNAQ